MINIRKRVTALGFSAFFLLLLVIGMTTRTQAAGMDTMTINVTYGQTAARQMLDYVNRFRAGRDVDGQRADYWNSDNATKTDLTGKINPLVYDYTLEKAAMQRAAEIAILFDHTRPNGQPWYTAMSGSGYGAMGENIAMGYSDSYHTFLQWREDRDKYAGQGHRRNMLSKNYNRIGIGHVVYKGMHYWVQELGYGIGTNTPTPANDGAANVSIEVPPGQLAYVNDGWYYVRGGMIDRNFNGFAKNENGWWYLENGKVTFGKNEVIYGAANTDASLGKETAWWLVRGSKVVRATTVASNANGWWYVKDGKVDFSYTGVAKNENGWWKITNGKVDFGFRGFERNEYGWWYLENGKVSFGKNEVIHGAANTDASLGKETAWWLVRGSKVVKATTVASNANGWWYVKDGKVDFTYTGIANNEYGWWKLTNGKVDFGFRGFERNGYGWWYLENGKVTFAKNEVIRGAANTDASLGKETAWWLVRGSKVVGATTVASNANGWWYVKDGKVDFTYTGVANNEYGWWKITNGKVDFGFRGFERNEYGWWYLENGKVTFGKNDVIRGAANTDASLEKENAWWLVRGSKVVGTTTVASNANGWWYVKDGRVDFTYTGLATNENGTWYIKDGKVDFGFNGTITWNDEEYVIRKGKVNS